MVRCASSRNAPLKAIEITAPKAGQKRKAPSAIAYFSPTGQPHSIKPASTRYAHAM